MKFSIFGRSISFTGKKSLSVKSTRSEAGSQSRLYADWVTATKSANAAIAGQLITVRNRSRQLEEDNDYAEKYYKLLENNVLGHSGIALQMKVKDFNGSFDTVANNKIETPWYRWTERENCTIDGQDSFWSFERLMLRSTARDGGAFARKIIGADNPFGFALQAIEVDMLDVGFNGRASNGNEIVMGVELGKFTSGGVTYRKPAAYWFFKSHPGDTFFGTTTSNLSLERISADQIIHTFKKKRIGQVVGFPWMAVCMASLKMLDGYEEAVLVAAREGACKGGYITNENPTEFEGDAIDKDGNATYEMEPGVVRNLKVGQGFVPHDPTHPMQEYSDFIKARLRRLASGLGVSYNSLASDLEGVNYSSIRAGLLDERDEWKTLQRWFIECFHSEVFKSWLPMAILSGQIALPMAKLEKFKAAEWKARRWAWVDPLKDINAKILAVENGFEARRDVISEGGGDIEDVFQSISEDEKLAESYKLKFGSEKEAIAQSLAMAQDEDPPKKKPAS